ncbi:MAG: hypothetical protein WCL57_06810 [Chloroflexota bacterium]|jgi:hypothetical protein|nr:hypothetical protein [Chloroflexota bacterium]
MPLEISWEALHYVKYLLQRVQEVYEPNEAKLDAEDALWANTNMKNIAKLQKLRLRLSEQEMQGYMTNIVIHDGELALK